MDRLVGETASLIASAQTRGWTHAQTAAELNALGLRNDHGDEWNGPAVAQAKKRLSDPEAHLQRIDNVEGIHRLSLHLLQVVADSDGPRSGEAREMLSTFTASRRAGASIEQSVADAKQAGSKVRQGSE